MSKRTWDAVPTMTEEYFPKNDVFEKIEDIIKEEMVTAATDDVWLKFTSDWTWPGPQVKLVGGPAEIKPRVGIQAIPFDSVKVDIVKAFSLADERLKQTNGGDKFIGAIMLYWPLVGREVAPEPIYVFTTNMKNTITIGAYSGEVNGPE